MDVTWKEIGKMFGKQSQVHSWMYIACIAAFSHQFFVVVEGLANNIINIMARVQFSGWHSNVVVLYVIR